MKQEVTITFKGIELEIVGNYFKGDKETRDYLGSNSCFEINKILAGFIDIYDLFSWKDIDSIEELVLEKLEM